MNFYATKNMQFLILRLVSVISFAIMAAILAPASSVLTAAVASTSLVNMLVVGIATWLVVSQIVAWMSMKNGSQASDELGRDRRGTNERLWRKTIVLAFLGPIVNAIDLMATAFPLDAIHSALSMPSIILKVAIFTYIGGALWFITSQVAAWFIAKVVDSYSACSNLFD